MRRIRTLGISLLLVLLAGYGICVAQAENTVPEEVSFEIKFMLDQDVVLGEDHLFTEEFRQLFALEDEYKPIDVEYLDTADQAFSDEGWINRIRWKSGKEEVERVYKKRYPVDGEDIAGALAAAAEEGFDLEDDRYSAQIDWQYSGMALSFSYESSDVYPDYSSLDQFSLEDAVNFLKEEMPEEELNWKTENWGSKTLEQAQIAGPVQFLRAKGTWKDIEVKAEIWPVPENGSTVSTTYICELSAEVDDLVSASEVRGQLMTYLDENKILVSANSLKTQVILDAYLK